MGDRKRVTIDIHITCDTHKNGDDRYTHPLGDRKTGNDRSTRHLRDRKSSNSRYTNNVGGSKQVMTGTQITWETVCLVKTDINTGYMRDSVPGKDGYKHRLHGRQYAL